MFYIKELLSYIAQSLVVAIGDSVDSAFGNNISIDTIVVMGSFLTISWVLSCLAKAGAYIFRIWQNRVWTCVTVSGIVSVIIGWIAVLLHAQLSHLFVLTDIQYKMLENIIILYGICLPIVGIGEVLDMYCLMREKIKCLSIADVVFYILLIGLDALVVILKLDCVWLVAGTMFSFFVFDVILLFSTGILQECSPVLLKDCILCLKHAVNILISKISIRIAIIFMRTMVSDMGTIPYALYTVANAVEEFNENYVAAWENFLTVKIKQERPENRFSTTKEYFKRHYKLFFLLFCISIPITALVLRGELNYFDVLFYACFVSLGNFFGYTEKTFYAYLSAFEKSSILRWDGIIGASVRILCCLLVYICGGSLIGYLLCYPIDTVCRAIYTYFMSKRVDTVLEVDHSKLSSTSVA